jgi:hypothetical protein
MARRTKVITQEQLTGMREELKKLKASPLPKLSGPAKRPSRSCSTRSASCSRSDTPWSRYWRR